jgi:cytochrome c
LKDLKMKRVLFAALAAVCLSHSAFADEKLAGTKNCLACHSVNTQVVGPAFKDVAKKYADDKGAVNTLAAKVRAGGGGVWGAIPMPANPQVSEAEAKKLVTWVLSLK